MRHVVLTAVSGDTVDLSALTCGTITLQSGAIHVDVDDLTVQGPGATTLAIDGNASDRVLLHGGAGTLSIAGLAVTHGAYASDTAWGGCIFSRGSITLTDAIVSGCTASGGSLAIGGGLAAYYSITLNSSTVSGNVASQTSTTPGSPAAAYGGGLVARDYISALFSTVSGNQAIAVAANAYGGGAVGAIGVSVIKYSTFSDNSAVVNAAGGGMYYGFVGGLLVTSGGARISHSTFESNHADVAAGLAFGLHTTPTGSVTISESTVSGNMAAFEVGGVLCGADLTLSNSTIAFNEAGSYGGGGLIAAGDTLDLESSIIADNTPTGSHYQADLSVGLTTTITGANNLVKITDAAVPADTIRSDPLLGPLQDNGGATRTHALTSGSPAIDSGNNAAGSETDQRGPGFVRVVGAAADIGAFETNPDLIFANGFN